MRTLRFSLRVSPYWETFKAAFPSKFNLHRENDNFRLSLNFHSYLICVNECPSTGKVRLVLYSFLLSNSGGYTCHCDCSVELTVDSDDRVKRISDETLAEGLVWSVTLE